MSEEQRDQTVRADLRIDVLEYIEMRGSSLGFPAARRERLALMNAAIRQGLIAWNRMRGKFELTTQGNKCLAEHRHQTATEV